tara:strand:+ start:851 stop:1471 length:621 start_codon:yes stop_codon:yes gene_type:complete
MPDDTTTLTANARDGSTGKTLTDSQFDESWALATILHRAICKTGSFREKLTDYAHAFARSEKFDQMRAETIIREQFKARYGQTMNQFREDLKDRETNLPEKAREEAFGHAHKIAPLICGGDTMPFYRAFDTVGVALAQKLDITETGAKELMKSTFFEAEGRDLYEASKALEKTYHDPVRKTATQARGTETSDSDATPKKARTRSRA